MVDFFENNTRGGMMLQLGPRKIRKGWVGSFVVLGVLPSSMAIAQDSGVSILFGNGSVPAQQVTTASQEPSESEKQPIVLPPLPTRNLSISGIGTGKLPDDLVEGRLPALQTIPYGPDRMYGLYQVQKTWTAPVFCHQPLYFEDTMLERHGHERFPKLTPMLSGVRFFSGVATLPYQVYLHRPLADHPNTGHFRPGSAAPGVRERAPYDKGALRFQILTTGASFVALQR